MLSKEQDKLRKRAERTKRSLEQVEQDRRAARLAQRKFRLESPDKAKQLSDNYRQSRRMLLSKHKAKPCKDCGDEHPPYVMDFDHCNPEEKSFNISEGYRCSFERLLAEIAKCDVVCANCHRERSHGQGF